MSGLARASARRLRAKCGGWLMLIGLVACHGGRLNGGGGGAGARGGSAGTFASTASSGAQGAQDASGNTSAPWSPAGGAGGSPASAGGSAAAPRFPSGGSHAGFGASAGIGTTIAPIAGTDGSSSSGSSGDGAAGSAGTQAGPDSDASAAADARTPAPAARFVAPRVVYVGQPRTVRVFGRDLDAADGAAVFVDGVPSGTLSAVRSGEGRVTLPGLVHGEHFLTVGAAGGPERARLFTAEPAPYVDDEVAIPGPPHGLLYDPERDAFFGAFGGGSSSAPVLARVRFAGAGWRVEAIDVRSPADVAITADGAELLVATGSCILSHVDPGTLAVGQVEDLGDACRSQAHGVHVLRTMADGRVLYGDPSGLWDRATGTRSDAPTLRALTGTLSQHQTQLLWAEGSANLGPHTVHSYDVASATFRNARTVGGDWQPSMFALSGDGERFMHYDDVYDRSFEYLGRLDTDCLTPRVALSGNGSVAISYDQNALLAYDVSGLVGPFPATGSPVPLPHAQIGEITELLTDDAGETAFAFTTRTIDDVNAVYEHRLVVRRVPHAAAPPVQERAQPANHAGEQAAALYVAPRVVFAGEPSTVRVFGRNIAGQQGHPVSVDGVTVGLLAVEAGDAHVALPALAAGEHALRVEPALAGEPASPLARLVVLPRAQYADAELALPGNALDVVYDPERGAFFVAFDTGRGARIQYDGVQWRADPIPMPSTHALALTADGARLLVMTDGFILAHLDPSSLSLLATEDLPVDFGFDDFYDTVIALADGQTFYGQTIDRGTLFEYLRGVQIATLDSSGAVLFRSQDQTRFFWTERSSYPPHHLHAYDAGRYQFDLLYTSSEMGYWLDTLAASADGRKLIVDGSVYGQGFEHLGDLDAAAARLVGLSGDGMVAVAFEYTQEQQSVRAFDLGRAAGPFPARGEAVPFPVDRLGVPRRLIVDDQGRTVFAFTDSSFVVRKLPSP